MSLPGDLIVVARGEADQPQRELFDAPTRASVRYADPAAWTTATAIARAVAPIREVIAAERDRVSIVVTSARGPVETMATVAEASRAGFASPLRYPAANPGSLTGVACILFGLRGSSLNLTLPAAEGVPIGLLVAGRWLQNRAVPLVVLAACSLGGPGRYLARCLVLARQDSPLGPGAADRSDPVAWLIAVPADLTREAT
jgi:hypothetical protein